MDLEEKKKELEEFDTISRKFQNDEQINAEILRLREKYHEAISEDEKEDIHQTISELIQLKTERKLEGFAQLEGIVFNFRDISRVSHVEAYGGHVKLKKGLIFRSAWIDRGSLNQEQAKKAVRFFVDTLNIKSMIDFRSSSEMKKTDAQLFIENEFPTVKDEENPTTERRRFRVPLLNMNVKLQGLFWQSPRTAKFKMLEAAFTTANRKSVSRAFVEEAFNPIGLVGLNKKILEYAKYSIAKVLRICASEDNYPIVFHCSSGKDRTGLIAALLLFCCGLSEEAIIEDYAISSIYLEPVAHLIEAENRLQGLDPSWDSTPKEVMQQTFEYIKEKYGSTKDYLVSCGFTEEEQMQLRKNLLAHSDHTQEGQHFIQQPP